MRPDLPSLSPLPPRRPGNATFHPEEKWAERARVFARARHEEMYEVARLEGGEGEGCCRVETLPRLLRQRGLYGEADAAASSTAASTAAAAVAAAAASASTAEPPDTSSGATRSGAAPPAAPPVARPVAPPVARPVALLKVDVEHDEAPLLEAMATRADWAPIAAVVVETHTPDAHARVLRVLRGAFAAVGARDDDELPDHAIVWAHTPLPP